MICTLCLYGCVSGSLGRKMDAAMSAFSSNGEALTADKSVVLAKGKFSSEYVVVVDNKKLYHLGEDIKLARATKFSNNNIDYAVLTCFLKDNSVKNMLVAIPPNHSGVAIYNMNSNSNNPFVSRKASKYMALVQQVSGGSNVWAIYGANDVRGPSFVDPKKKGSSKRQSSTAKANATKSSGSQSSPAVSSDVKFTPLGGQAEGDTPPAKLETDTKVRVEEVEAPKEKPAPAPQPAPAKKDASGLVFTPISN